MLLNELKEITKINIDDYIYYREEVKKSMINPEWLGDLSKEVIIDLLNNGSKIWMFYLENEFVCSMMYIPSTLKDLEKFNLNYNYKEVADYGPMMVNSKFIGNKLQYQMLKKLDEYSKKINIKYVVSTIHPDNFYSINNLLKDNFKCIGLKEFKRGIRNIYFKEL